MRSLLDPSTYEETTEHQVWKDVMIEEYQPILKNDVWEIVLRPGGKSVVSSKWTYRIKHATDGSIEKYKARFVARGFSQKEGDDLKTFAPVARYSSISVVIALASIAGWKLQQLDVKTAFLNGVIEEEVYNDLFLTGAEVLIVQCKRELTFKFEMKDLGLINYYLGLEIWQKPDEIFVGQGKYTINILQKFGMMDCKSMDTPMMTNLKKLRDCDSNLVDPSMRRKLIGSLNCLVNIKPDICYAVNTLSQFLVEPRHVHWVATKHILRYLRGTIDYGLRYVFYRKWQLHGFTDADWVGCTNDRKSTSGFCFSLGSIMISWSSKKQTFVALSTTEVEYIAACSTCCEVVWLHKLFAGLFDKVLESTIVYCDNQSCVKLSKNPTFHDKF
eukprot:PITA_13786